MSCGICGPKTGRMLGATTHSDKCAAGVCHGTSYSCDDKLGCTTDSCIGIGPSPGGCNFVLLPGYCLISGGCYVSGTADPGNACNVCDPALSTSVWKQIPCVATFAGDGTPGFGDGPAATAKFNMPYGVAVDSAGKVFVADAGNCRIRVVSGGKTLGELHKSRGRRSWRAVSYQGVQKYGRTRAALLTWLKQSAPIEAAQMAAKQPEQAVAAQQAVKALAANASPVYMCNRCG